VVQWRREAALRQVLVVSSLAGAGVVCVALGAYVAVAGVVVDVAIAGGWGFVVVLLLLWLLLVLLLSMLCCCVNVCCSGAWVGGGW
jgi:hypothetical protein